MKPYTHDPDGKPYRHNEEQAEAAKADMIEKERLGPAVALWPLVRAWRRTHWADFGPLTIQWDPISGMKTWRTVLGIERQHTTRSTTYWLRFLRLAAGVSFQRGPNDTDQQRRATGNQP